MVQLWEGNLLSLPDILNCCNFSQATFYCIIKLWHRTGIVVSHGNTEHSHSRFLDATDVQYLNQLIEENPDYFLDKLLHLLKTNHLHHHPQPASSQWCQPQKTQHIASKQDEAGFIACIAQYACSPWIRVHQWGFKGQTVHWEMLWSISPWLGSSKISTIHLWLAYFNCWMSHSWGLCLGNFSGRFIHIGDFFGLAGTQSGKFPLFFCISHLSNNNSCPNAIHTLVFSVSLCLTMWKFIMAMKFWSFLIILASILNTSLLTHLTTTPLRKPFLKSSTSWGYTRTTMDRGQAIVFYMTCMRYWI